MAVAMSMTYPVIVLLDAPLLSLLLCTSIGSTDAFAGAGSSDPVQNRIHQRIPLRFTYTLRSTEGCHDVHPLMLLLLKFLRNIGFLFFARSIDFFVA